MFYYEYSGWKNKVQFCVGYLDDLVIETKWWKNSISEELFKEHMDCKTFPQFSFVNLDNLCNITINVKMFSNCHCVSSFLLCVCTVPKWKEGLHDFPEIVKTVTYGIIEIWCSYEHKRISYS